MVVVASVVGCPIQSVYPPRNDILDKAVGILNTIFKPVSVKSKDPIYILWRSSCYGYNKTWLPDHVPLINKDMNIS